jgi:RHS repeat-associated protein
MDTSYDGAGNVVQEFGPRVYTWDPLGMMTSATVGGRTFRYLYDASNERIAAVERVPVGAELRNRTTFTLRGTGNQLLSTWTDDWTSGTRVFTRKEDTIWRGSQVLALATPLTEMNYALDHLGSPRLITSAVGGVIDQQTFDPFGEGGLYGSGALQFTAHERDRANLGGGVFDLPDYFHARYYDTAGRFLSVDPVLDQKFALSNPQGWNRYAYVRNNPINKTDPTGRCEDPKPNSGGTRICIQTFIPTVTFAGFVGDNRTAQPNGGTFRTNQSIMFSGNGKKAVAPPLQAGVSRLALAPNLVARTSVVAQQSVTTVGPGTVRARAAVSDGLLFGQAPNASYDMTISVDKNGGAAVIGGTHSGYPALEVWSYRDGAAPDAIYTYNPARKDSFGGLFNISAVTVDVESGIPSLDPNVP